MSSVIPKNIYNIVGESINITNTSGSLALNNGNVGIGISNPVIKLHVHNGSGYFGNFTGFNTSNTALITFVTGGKLCISSGINGLPATTGTNGNAIALRIRGGDNATLDFGANSINTWIQATDFSGGYANNYHIHLNPNGGNVAIGNGGSTPSYKLHINGDTLTNGWFRTTGDTGLWSETYARGIRPAILGDYGNVETHGEGKNNFEGFSIHGRYAFMSADNNQCGIFNDIDNQWIWYYDRVGSSIELRQNDSVRLLTQSYGVSIPSSNSLYIGDKPNNVPTAKLFIKCDAGANDNLDKISRGIKITNNFWTNSWNIGHRNSENPYNNSADLCFAHLGGSDTSDTAFNPTNKCIMRAFGNNVTLNFTGQHRCFVDGETYDSLQNLIGLIVVANKNDYIKMSGGTVKGKDAITIQESLPIVSLSKFSMDKKCFGVICMIEDPESRQDEFGNIITPYIKEKGDTRSFINSIGEGAMWVTNINGNLESGDYITTSDIPGYGMRQNDDIFHNYTVAKITMDCDFTSPLKPKYKIKKNIIKKEYINLDSNMPKSGSPYNQENEYINGENILDENGNLIWEQEIDSSNTAIFEKSYDIRYIDIKGIQITESEYNSRQHNGENVYIAAFVGCTYHCG